MIVAPLTKTVLLDKRAFDTNFLPLIKYVTGSFPFSGKVSEWNISFPYKESLHGTSVCTTAGKLLACQSGSAVFTQLLIA